MAVPVKLRRVIELVAEIHPPDRGEPYLTLRCAVCCRDTGRAWGQQLAVSIPRLLDVQRLAVEMSLRQLSDRMRQFLMEER